MFTGIIEAVGQIDRITPKSGDVELRVHCPGLDMADVQLGDSIATNGICLTVIEFGPGYFVADVSAETLRRTTLGQWRSGTRVNLEKALLPTTRLGGHLVSGHVDGLGTITVSRQDARSLYFEVEAPRELARYLAEKGSITVDGISLTINVLKGATLSLNLVPHTATKTNIGDWKVGTQVNLEVDVLARYLERLLLGDRAADHDGPHQDGGITLEFLAQHGFAGKGRG